MGNGRVDAARIPAIGARADNRSLPALDSLPVAHVVVNLQPNRVLNQSNLLFFLHGLEAGGDVTHAREALRKLGSRSLVASLRFPLLQLVALVVPIDVRAADIVPAKGQLLKIVLRFLASHRLVVLLDFGAKLLKVGESALQLQLLLLGDAHLQVAVALRLALYVVVVSAERDYMHSVTGKRR